MKNKLLLNFGVLFCLCKISSSQPTMFQSGYGGSQADEATCVQQTFDNGYIITGQTKSYGQGDYDVYLIKTDSVGNILWTKTFGGTNVEYGYCVKQTSDSGFIVGGYTQSFGAAQQDFYLIKTDVIGNLSWSKILGGPGNDIAHSVSETFDGGYIICGETDGQGAGATDAYLIKTDNIGNISWARGYGGAASEVGYDVIQTSDSGFIFAGKTNSFGLLVAPDFYLVKTDASGIAIWSKTFGESINGTSKDYANSVEQTSDGGYIVAGSTTSFGAGIEDAYIVKTNSSGDTLWTKRYGGSNYDYAYAVKQTTDGGYIIAGQTQSFGAGGKEYYLIRTDSTGTTIWSKTYGIGTSDERGFSIQQTSDGGFIIGGQTNGFGLGSTGCYIVKTDENGNSGCNDSFALTSSFSTQTLVVNPATQDFLGGTFSIPLTLVSTGGNDSIFCTNFGDNTIEIGKENLLTVSPNPFSNQFSISGTTDKGVIVIFDMTGKQILQQKTFNEYTRINTEHLLQGVYLLHFFEGNKIVNIKLVKF